MRSPYRPVPPRGDYSLAGDTSRLVSGFRGWGGPRERRLGGTPLVAPCGSRGAAPCLRARFFPSALTAYGSRFSARPCGPPRPGWDGSPSRAASTVPVAFTWGFPVPSGDFRGFPVRFAPLFSAVLSIARGACPLKVDLVHPWRGGSGHGSALGLGIAPPWFPRLAGSVAISDDFQRRGVSARRVLALVLVFRPAACSPRARGGASFGRHSIAGACSLRMVGAVGLPLYVRPTFVPPGPLWGRLGALFWRVLRGGRIMAALPCFASWGRPGAVFMRPRWACPFGFAVNGRGPRLNPPCGAGLLAGSCVLLPALLGRLCAAPAAPVTDAGTAYHQRPRCGLGLASLRSGDLSLCRPGDGGGAASPALLPPTV